MSCTISLRTLLSSSLKSSTTRPNQSNWSALWVCVFRLVGFFSLMQYHKKERLVGNLTQEISMTQYLASDTGQYKVV